MLHHSANIVGLNDIYSSCISHLYIHLYIAFNNSLLDIHACLLTRLCKHTGYTQHTRIHRTSSERMRSRNHSSPTALGASHPLRQPSHVPRLVLALCRRRPLNIHSVLRRTKTHITLTHPHTHIHTQTHTHTYTHFPTRSPMLNKTKSICRRRNKCRQTHL